MNKYTALLLSLFLLPALLFASKAATPQRLQAEIREQRSTIDAIATAIQQRSAITFTYKGAQRTVHPHRLGKSKTGNVLLRAWEKEEEGVPVNGWRLYKVQEIKSARLIEATSFEIAPNYKSPDSSIPTVFLEIPINNKRAAE